MKHRTFCRCIAWLMIIFLLAGCQSTYYAVWEKLGKEKRHLLKDEIEDARDDQMKASEAFEDALTQLKAFSGFEGGDLEKAYDRISEDYENCKARADQVDERIENVERIARDLFAEWASEIEQIHKQELKTKSRQKLEATKSRYERLDRAMHTARNRMTPILATQQDYVLYLKHNLNAQAIGSLKGEVDNIETDINRLVRDIENSIEEADAFLKIFEGQQ